MTEEAALLQLLPQLVLHEVQLHELSLPCRQAICRHCTSIIPTSKPCTRLGSAELPGRIVHKQGSKPPLAVIRTGFCGRESSAEATGHVSIDTAAILETESLLYMIRFEVRHVEHAFLDGVCQRRGRNAHLLV